MSKRIFTKVLHYQGMAQTPAEVDVPGAAQWLLQEDIEVLGAHLLALVVMPSENDGFAWCYCELSQTAILNQDGIILAAEASEWWNTAPAGIAKTKGEVNVVFPAGMAIPVKEEGYLYLNARLRGKTAGASMFEVEAIVYYTKRGA